MDCEFCKVKVPVYMTSNANDCPINYFLRKHNYNINVPAPFKCEKNTYVICLPSAMYVDFMQRLARDEDCEYFWIKTQKVGFNTLENARIIMEGNDYVLRINNQ
jgi:hypothetical protein